MRTLWIVAALEVKLALWRRGVWLAALLLALFGVWDATQIREAVYEAWGELALAAALVSLTLTLSTGDQIIRDRERRLEGVVFSTPVGTIAYVCGKYLGAAVAALALSGIELTAAVLTDQMYAWRDPPMLLGRGLFPPLGPAAYVAAWAWLVVTPVLFGTALTMAGITLGRGQRVGTYAIVLLLWVGPVFLSGTMATAWPNLLDVTTLQLDYTLGVGAILSRALLYDLLTQGSHIDAALAQHIVQLVQRGLPPHFPVIFYWNRLLFLVLPIGLVAITAVATMRRRRGAA